MKVPALKFLYITATLTFFILIMIGGCGGKGAPLELPFSFSLDISSMGSRYSGNVIPVHLVAQVSTGNSTVIPLGQGFGSKSIYADFSVDNGQTYSACHDTEGKTYREITFTEAPSIQEMIFHWDVAFDLGENARVDKCIIRVRMVTTSQNPVTSFNDETFSTEFSINSTFDPEVDCGQSLIIKTSALPYVVDSNQYVFVFEVDNGYGELTWSAEEPFDTEVVSGLELSPFGLLFGKPVVADEYKAPLVAIELKVRVTDSCPNGPRSGSRTFILNILDKEADCASPPEFNPDQVLKTGTELEDYSCTLQIDKGEGGLSIEFDSDTLPAGLQFNADEKSIWGTPSEGSAGEYPLTFMVIDSCIFPQSNQISLNLIINPPDPCADPPLILSTHLASVGMGQSTLRQLVGSGGEGKLTWSLLDRSLPPDLHLSADGLLSGFVSCDNVPGSYEYDIGLTDSCKVPQSDIRRLQLVVNPPASCDPLIMEPVQDLPDGKVGEPYVYTIVDQSPGWGNLTLVETVNKLPSGLEAVYNRIIGIPEPGTSGFYTGELKVYDQCPCYSQSDSFQYEIYISPTEISCLSQVPSNHTFCLNCPDSVAYNSSGQIELYFIRNPYEALPKEVRVEIIFTPTYARIPGIEIFPGPAVAFPDNFSVIESSGRMTISCTPDIGFPASITHSGLFATMQVENKNSRSTDRTVRFDVLVTILKDCNENDLAWQPGTCTLSMMGN